MLSSLRTLFRGLIVVAMHGLPLGVVFAQRLPNNSLKIVEAKVLMDDRDGRLPTDMRWAKVVPLSDGRVVFFDALVPRIWVADKTGRSMQLGREGSGPGEFRMPAFAGEIDDTLWIFDVALRRFSHFSTANLKFLRSNNWPGGTADGWDLGSPSAINGNGMAVVPGGGDKRILASGGVRWVPLFLVDSKASRKPIPLISLHVLNASHKIVQERSRRTVVRDQPFVDRSVFATSPNGTRLAVVTQADEHERRRDSIVVFDVGRLPRVRWGIQLRTLREPFTRRQAEQAIEKDLALVNEAARTSNVAPIERSDYLTHLSVPRTRTSAAHVLVDNEGAVLIRGNDWLRDSVTYSWFSSPGESLGHLRVPAGFHIRALHGTQILALRRSSDDEFTLISGTLSK